MDNELLEKAIELVKNWLTHTQGCKIHATEKDGDTIYYYATEYNEDYDTVGKVIRFCVTEGDMPEETDHAENRKDLERKIDKLIEYLPEENCVMGYDIVYLRILNDSRAVLKLARNVHS